MPRKYSVEFKDKAVHQIIEMVRLESCSLQRAYTEVGELLGVSHHTLRAWYRDSGGCPILCVRRLGLQVIRESVGVRHS